MFQKNPGIEKVFALPEEDITIFCQVVARFPVESFIVSQQQFFRRETFQCSGKNWVSENFMHDGGGITFFHRNFSISKYRNTSWGTLLCFINCLVWKEFMNRRGVSQCYVQIF